MSLFKNIILTKDPEPEERITLPESFVECEYIESLSADCLFLTTVYYEDIIIETRIKPAVKQNVNQTFPIAVGSNIGFYLNYMQNRGFTAHPNLGYLSSNPTEELLVRIRFKKGVMNCFAYSSLDGLWRSQLISGSSNKNAALAFFSYKTGLNNAFLGRIYRIKVYDGSSGALVSDLIPAINTAANRVCFYNLIREMPYSSSSGTFNYKIKES